MPGCCRRAADITFLLYRRLAALALLLAIAACDPPDAILDAEEALLNPPRGTVYPTDTPGPEIEAMPTALVRPGVVVDGTLVRMDSEGKLRVTLDGEEYRLRLEREKATGWRARLEPAPR